MNGVNNDEANAKKSLERVIFTLTSTEESSFVGIPFKDICYQVAHNHSEGLTIDVIETIGQKLQEELGADFKWKMVAEYLINKGKFFTGISSDYPFAEGKIKETISEIIESNAIAAQEEATVNKVYNEVVKVFKKMPTLVVSHSQGNLFANSLYDKLEYRNSGDAEFINRLKTEYANLQIASAAKEPNSEIHDAYTAVEDGIIIKRLRDLGGFEVIDPEYAILDFDSEADFLKHGFVETYISPLVYTTTSSNWLTPTKEMVEVEGEENIFKWNGFYIGENGDKVDKSYVVLDSAKPAGQRTFSSMQDVFVKKAGSLARTITSSCLEAAVDVQMIPSFNLRLGIDIKNELKNGLPSFYIKITFNLVTFIC